MVCTPRLISVSYTHLDVYKRQGYTWEQLTGAIPCHARCEVTDQLLSLLDVLVDGRFVQACLLYTSVMPDHIGSGLVIRNATIEEPAGC